MVDTFVKILNMSITASWLILAVVLLRFILKKAPKWIAVLLWGIVALRLVVPFSFESALSLIPSAEVFNAPNIQYETPTISSGVPSINNAVNPALSQTFAPSSVGSINPLYIWTLVLSVIWLIGIAVMLLYALISYVRVHRSVAERVPYEENIFLCDHVKSPFILGLVRPRIYLPSNMDAASMEPVIAHEKAHLARRDHWWKPLGFLILAVHWFNPLCWVAYVLLCRDIELACDEKVIRQMDVDGKKQYSSALLECSVQRRLVTICPLAFGEVGVKERVKKVLHYKKPAFWIIVAAVVACALVTVCFATNPVTAEPGKPDGNDTVNGRELTLDDVIMLSQKGDVLTWSDFEQYQGREIGSGLYIMQYEIDELFEVWVGGVPDEKPMYIYLRVNNEAEDCIDIRTENVSAFIETHRNDMPKVVEPKPDGGGEPAPEEPDFSSVIKWFDCFNGDEMVWDGIREYNLDEFSGVIFRWQYGRLEAVTEEKAVTLYTGMPIWSVYFCDLTGDGNPEICSTISFGSGIMDNRIIVYDYACGLSYELSDRGNFDYVLNMQEDSLIVEKRVYMQDELVESGELVFLDDTIQIKTEG